MDPRNPAGVSLAMLVVSWLGVAIGRFVDKRRCERKNFIKIVGSSCMLVLLGWFLLYSGVVYSEPLDGARWYFYWVGSYAFSVMVWWYFHYYEDILNVYLTKNTSAALADCPLIASIVALYYPLIFFFV